MESVNPIRTNHRSTLIEQMLEANQGSRGRIHACRVSQRNLQQAYDQLARANRDLGETVACIAASLTTITAVEAVINITNDRVGLSKDILQVTLNVYLLVFALIFTWGAVHVQSVMRRRARAEHEIDQAKKGIFDFCSEDQWPKLDE